MMTCQMCGCSLYKSEMSTGLCLQCQRIKALEERLERLTQVLVSRGIVHVLDVGGDDRVYVEV